MMLEKHEYVPSLSPNFTRTERSKYTWLFTQLFGYILEKTHTSGDVIKYVIVLLRSLRNLYKVHW